MPHLNLLEPELEPQKHVLSVFEHLSSLLIKPTHLMAIVVTNCHNHSPSSEKTLEEVVRQVGEIDVVWMVLERELGGGPSGG